MARSAPASRSRYKEYLCEQQLISLAAAKSTNDMLMALMEGLSMFEEHNVSSAYAFTV
jgi:hypothetical protein